MKCQIGHKDGILRSAESVLVPTGLASGRTARYTVISNVALMTFLTLLSFIIPLPTSSKTPRTKRRLCS